MKTQRIDVERNKQFTFCPNATTLGWSTYKLRLGNFFLYRDGDKTRLAKYHGKIRPVNYYAQDYKGWYILAQVADATMRYTMERWILDYEVIETIPAEQMNDHVIAFFIQQENNK